jgi:acyl transferase domain-containing protein
MNDNKNRPGALIAICGISTRLPGGIRNADQFWESIVNGGASHDPVRLDADDYGNDMKEGLAVDASLFSMTDEEAKNSSPQQQRLLEVTRECFEDACEVNYRGEDAFVGCYVGTSNQDDASMLSSKNDLKGPRFVSKIIAP